MGKKPLSPDWDPFAPIASLPEEIQRDIATERGHAQRPAPLEARLDDLEMLTALRDEIVATLGPSPLDAETRATMAEYRQWKESQGRSPRALALADYIASFDDLEMVAASRDEIVAILRRVPGPDLDAIERWMRLAFSAGVRTECRCPDPPDAYLLDEIDAMRKAGGR